MDAAKLSFFRELSRENRWLYFAIAILVIGFASKLIRLQLPAQHYFDEVYHGYTAQVYVQGDSKAYDPWASPPKGFAYEWTHPPLAKVLMAAFLAVFGDKFFWMRFGSALFGTASVLLTGLIAFRYLKSIPVAVLAMTFLSLETLHFAQSRIAMNDSYFVFFMLLTFLVYLRMRETKGIAPKHVVVTGLVAGLALGTKWTGFYVIGIIGLDQVIRWWRTRKHAAFSDYLARAFIFLTAAGVGYLFTFVHYFSLGFNWEQFKELQRQMWWYHNNLSATHAYQSKPWQWIFNLKPVWMYVDYSESGKVGNIYNAGNSVVLLGGLFAVLVLTGKALKGWLQGRKTQVPMFLLFCYFMLWLPWVFSPRIMLFYHYLPAVPFLCMLLAYALWNLPKRVHASYAVLGAALIWFAVFYPHVSGVRVPTAVAERFYYVVFPR